MAFENMQEQSSRLDGTTITLMQSEELESVVSVCEEEGIRQCYLQCEALKLATSLSCFDLCSSSVIINNTKVKINAKRNIHFVRLIFNNIVILGH